MNTYKKWSNKNLINDIMAGIIVALVSIPISMGYAGIAGLPPVYGLYGSLLPILVFCILTTSPQFVVGVDAMPAAMVGSTLASMGIVAESKEAMSLVPVISLITAAWLFIFFLLKAGRIVKYISTPVMGGFISGIGCTIILMQVPKLFGGTAGTGELFTLLYHIGTELPSFHFLSAILGFGTIAIILISKKFMPKFPMTIVMMIAVALITAVFDIEKYGVKLLPSVPSGLPKLILPDFTILIGDGFAAGSASDIIFLSLTIALVIMAQTLLATNNYALKYNYKVDNNRELIGYAGMNIAGAIVGCCPINGSVSRTGMADQFKCKSQIMSITAGFVMILVLLFGTPVLRFLPVPVLTGIVITALIGILETKLARRLWNSSKNEFFIFAMAFGGVMIFGTLYGVLIGVILSFGTVIIRAVVPPTAMLGMIPGHKGLYNLTRNKNARPIKNTIIYKFGGNLFFANIGAFQDEIESAIKDDTKVIIVDARAIGNIDITAADRLVIMNKNLRDMGIKFYITEHSEIVNDNLRACGAASLIESGAVRRTWTLALRDAGIEKPYPLEGLEENTPFSFIESSEKLAEMEWAFGEEAHAKIEEIAIEIVNNIKGTDSFDLDALKAAESNSSWGRIGLFDEDELLEQLEVHILELAESGAYDEEKENELERKLEERRKIVEEKIKALNPKAHQMLKEHRGEIVAKIKERNPKVYAHLEEHRKHMHID